MERYWGIVMVLSAFVNGILLVETGRVSRHPPACRRWIPGAVLAGVYAALCLQPGLSFLGNGFCRILALIAVGVISFGTGVKQIVLFMLFSFAMEGIVTGLGGGKLWVAMPSAVFIILCAVLFRSIRGQERYIPVELQFRGKHMKLTALRDTGHGLYDPITGASVLVVDANISRELTGLSEQQLRQPVEVMRQPPIPGLRLIPYQTIGQSTGLLLGTRISMVRIGGWQGCIMVAFAPEEFSSKGEFQALTGGSV